jgi:glycolate oxidase
MIRFIQETGARHRLEIATFGHSGTGTSTRRSSRTSATRTRCAASRRDAEIFAHALSLGGTITGEHGVGLAKKPFLRGQLGDGSLALIKQVKRTLDPENLLNPGKIFDP